MKTESKVLRRYLFALRDVKMMNDKKGGVYSCFGGYNENNSSCKEQASSLDYIPCQICKAQVQRPSMDWLINFVEVL